MSDGPIHYVLLSALAIALLVAAVTDIRRRQIDNWLNASIVAAAPLFWWASAMSWGAIGWQLISAGIAFAGFTALFMLRQMGGGDVKLLTALALWIEPMWFLRLLVIMAIIGGVLTIALALHHRFRQNPGQLKIPYGVAISSAGLWVLALQNFSSFSPSVVGGGAG